MKPGCARRDTAGLPIRRVCKIRSGFKFGGTDASIVSEECDDREVLALLNDEYARAVLTETSAEPMSAKTLSERCDASLTTIYRRIDRLKECDLVEEQLQPQPDGNHYKVFVARLDSFAVEFEDGEMHTELERAEAEDPADRFTEMWEEL